MGNKSTQTLTKSKNISTMKNLKYLAALLALVMMAASCGQTTQKDTTTHSADTMVIKQDKTDSATQTMSTDTTKR